MDQKEREREKLRIGELLRFTRQRKKTYNVKR